MATPIDTGSMAAPGHYSSKLLDHLDLVAGMHDELGLGRLIDQIVPQDQARRTVSLGQAVKAMGLNDEIDLVMVVAQQLEATLVEANLC